MFRNNDVHGVSPRVQPQQSLPNKQEQLRHHVITRMTQDRSGRLYCSDDVDIEVPGLEIYAAR